MKLIDSHCHLDFPDFAPDIEGVLDRAREAGVERFITISTRVARGDALVALADRFEDVYFTIGTHPHEAANEPGTDLAAIEAFAAHPKCVGVGEAGLDYHYDNAPRDIAAKVFRAQIHAARALELPLVIHAREADDDVAAILEDEMGQGAFNAVLHCFTSSRALAERGLALGLYVSFSGVLTFKSAAALREIAADVPIDRLLVETDAPYLAPTPHRGGRNEPAYVVETARVLAAVKGVSKDEIGDITRANTFRLFSKMLGAVVTPP
jgi:TatD DNase family protein